MTTPARGLEYVKALPPTEEGHARVEALCDCGALTDLVIAWETKDGDRLEDAAPGTAATVPAQEVAFTCDCGTAHWLTLAPAQVAP